MYDSTKRYLYTLKPGQEFRVSGIDYILLTIDDGEHDGSVVAMTKEPMFSVDSYGRIVSLEERFNINLRIKHFHINNFLSFCSHWRTT